MSDTGPYQRSPNLGQTLNKAIDTAKRQIRVSFPASVQAYDPTTQTVDVQVLTDDQTQQEDGTFTALPYPVLTHVPVGFLAAGGFRITMPVAPGDTGQVLVCDHSIDAWKQQGGHTSPSERRRHHIADAVFYPGLHPDNASWTGASLTGVTIGKDGGPQIVIRAGTIELGGSDAVPPVNFAILGTAYRTAEDTLFGALGTALAGAGAGLASMGADVTFSGAYPAAAGFAAAAGAALETFAAALVAFELNVLEYISTTVLVK